MQARKRFHQELHLPAPSPGTCRLPGRREMNVCAEPQPGCGHGSRAQCRLFPSRLSASRPFSAFPRFPLGGRGRVRAGDTPVRPEQGPSARQGGAQRLGLGWILGHECDAAPVAGAPFLRPLSPPPGSGTISTAISPAGWSPDSSLHGLSSCISSAASLLRACSSWAPCSVPERESDWLSVPSSAS